jgi:hypothetical protein
MWRITRMSGTLQQIFIMVAMNVLHTKRKEKCGYRISDVMLPGQASVELGTTPRMETGFDAKDF